MNNERLLLFIIIIDWSRFGLSAEDQHTTEQLHADPDEVFEQHSSTASNELFREDQARSFNILSLDCLMIYDCLVVCYFQ